MNKLYTILIDGGYFTKIFRRRHGRYPNAADVFDVVARIKDARPFPDWEFLRVYYYDAPPLQIKVNNPINGAEINLGASDLAKNAQRLQTDLGRAEDFALRYGELKQYGWTLRACALGKGGKNQGSLTLTADDIKPEIKQKGVDLRIGMDIACMALRKTVNCIVILTGDSDMVPALKLARREGLRVNCVQLDNQKITDDLRLHTDRIIHVAPAPEMI